MTEPSQGLTIDMVIAKFLPIIGAILFVTGLGYLIYTSVWSGLEDNTRLGVGFFVSILIIGTAFSFAEKLRYFADVVMGGGILLLYGTLLYGSRATDSAMAIIPEVATLVTAFVFTLGVAYFASLRKSKVILILGILGAYLTPFILGQNDSWAHELSFNAYLVYFAAVNIVIFLMGREIAIYDLIPLNLLGLFFGTYSLQVLSYTDTSRVASSFFAGEVFTVILLVVLVMMSIAGIALSSRYFTKEKKDEIMLSIGYLVPLAWFLIQIDTLTSLSIPVRVTAFFLLTVAYFVAWYILRPLTVNRYQHIAVYTGGLISLVFAILALFPDFSVYSSILIAYIGLIFAVIYLLDGNKGERILASVLFSFFGGVLALWHIYGESSNVAYPTIFAIVGLIPAMLLAVIVRLQGKTSKEATEFVNIYSATAAGIALLILVIKFIQTLDFAFAFMVLPGFLIVLWTYIVGSSAQNRGSVMRIGTGLVTVGFFYSFFYFVANLAPHVADDEYFFRNGAIFGNWDFIKGVFAVLTYFLALSISRDIQTIEKTDRPSFLLVIIGYSSLLLLVNFAIITICNDLGVAFTTGGPRAIGTTIWWIILAISMLLIGIRYGRGYRSEKLLGLMLLLLTIGKIAFYDLATMDMNKKIIVLMVVGGCIMMFSYFLQVKGYLKDENV